MARPDLESPPEPQSLDAWRESALNLLIRSSLILALPAILLSVLGNWAAGQMLPVIFSAIGFTIVWWVARSRRMAVWPRAVVLTGTAYTVAFTLLLQDGLLSAANILFVMAPIFGALVFRRRGALVSAAIGSGLFVMGLGLRAAGLALPGTGAARSTDPAVLLIHGVMLCYAVWFMVAAIRSLLGRLSASLRAVAAANTSLEQRVAERTAELQVAERRLQLILHTIPEQFWMKDCDGRYLVVSDALARFHGYEPAQMIGKRGEDLYTAELVEAIRAGDDQVFTQGRATYVEREWLDCQRVPRWFGTSRAPIVDEQGALVGVVGLARDITERRQAELALARQLRYAEALAACSRTLLTPCDTQECYQATLEQALEILRAAIGDGRITIYHYPYWAEELNRTPSMIRMLAAANAPGLPPQVPPPPESVHDVPTALGDLMRSGQAYNGPAYFPDNPHFQHYQEINGVKAICYQPLFVGERWWGHMSLNSYTSDQPWDEPVIQLLRIAGEMVVTFVRGWEADQALIRAKEAAEAADRAKSTFLAMMSHEMRTPLNAVIGLTSLLRTTRLAPDQHELVATINTSGAALLAMIDDILDLTRIEFGQVTTERRPLNVARCVCESADLVAHAAQAKGLKLELAIDPTIPHLLFGDAVRLRQILTNLLANAVKFTDQGGVTLRAFLQDVGGRTKDESTQAGTGSIPLPSSSLSAEGGGKKEESAEIGAGFILHPASCILFEVSDTGIGLSPAQQERIFLPFVQADSSTTRRYGGSGLGLAISRQLAGLMGGTLTVASSLGAGATFTLKVPFETLAGAPDWAPPTPAADGAPTPPAADAAPADRSLRILVAEDNPVNQLVLRKLLEQLGLRADQVATGTAAVAAVKARPYDVVLMDVQMPELDGREATLAIRAADDSAHQPYIIALTAQALPGDREALLAVGMDAYLAKPVQLGDLRAALAQASVYANQVGGGRAQPVPDQPPAEKAAPLDAETLEALRAALDLPALTCSIAIRSLFAATLGRLTARLDQAIVADDRPLIQQVAQAIHRSAEQLGAPAIAATAGRLAALADTAAPPAIEEQRAQIHGAYREVVAYTACA